ALRVVVLVVAGLDEQLERVRQIEVDLPVHGLMNDVVNGRPEEQRSGVAVRIEASASRRRARPPRAVVFPAARAVRQVEVERQLRMAAVLVETDQPLEPLPLRRDQVEFL